MTRVLQMIGEAFWLLAIGVIIIFAFFAVLGALDPGDVAGISVVVVALLLLFLVRTWALRRRGEDMSLEERKSHERERRGF